MRAVMCAVCGFLFGEEDDPAAYGFSCPRCGAHTPKALVDLDLCPWWVVDALGQPVAGPFSEPGAAKRWMIAHFPHGHPRGPLMLGQRPAPGHVPAPATGQPTSARHRPRAERERVPALVDALDVQLGLWIAEAMLDP